MESKQKFSPQASLLYSTIMFFFYVKNEPKQTHRYGACAPRRSLPPLRPRHLSRGGGARRRFHRRRRRRRQCQRPTCGRRRPRQHHRPGLERVACERRQQREQRPQRPCPPPPLLPRRLSARKATRRRGRRWPCRQNPWRCWRGEAERQAAEGGLLQEEGEEAGERRRRRWRQLLLRRGWPRTETRTTPTSPPSVPEPPLLLLRRRCCY